MELLESLYYIETLSHIDYFDDLLQIALAQDIRFGSKPDPSVEDLALLLCLECPDEVERYHAQIHRDTKKGTKRFESYFVAGTVRTMFEPTLEYQKAIESELNLWALEHRRGIGMRVFITQEKNAVWFMFRHGQPMKRENAVNEEGGNHQVFYRPEKFDTAIYYPEIGELAVGVPTKGLRIAYMQAIGRCLFGDPAYFHIADCNKYTLQPLIDFGPESLVCLWNDHGLKKVTLHELHIDHHDNNQSLETWQGLNVFETLQEKERHLNVEKRISIRRAKLKVLRADNREHTLTIEPPNVALYDRESDHDIIHPWLVKRGFVINTPICEDQEHVEQDREFLGTP